MNSELAVIPMEASTLNALVLAGDLSKLTEAQMSAYYVYRCKAVGLDPATKPFDVLVLNGKKVLYATKECSSQLSHRDKLTAEIVTTSIIGGVYEVKARAKSPDGRFTDDLGVVSVEGLKGDALCNAMMKAATKGKRRAILTHCGLGMLDETEIETIPASAKGASTAIHQTMQKRTNAEIVAEMNAHTAKESTPALQSPNKTSAAKPAPPVKPAPKQEVPAQFKPIAGSQEWPSMYVHAIKAPAAGKTNWGILIADRMKVGGSPGGGNWYSMFCSPTNPEEGERLALCNQACSMNTPIKVLLEDKPSADGKKTWHNLIECCVVGKPDAVADLPNDPDPPDMDDEGREQPF